MDTNHKTIVSPSINMTMANNKWMAIMFPNIFLRCIRSPFPNENVINLEDAPEREPVRNPKKEIIPATTLLIP